jgi:hypothetical protein
VIAVPFATWLWLRNNKFEEVRMTQPICDDQDPEARAGELLPDPWDDGDTVDLRAHVTGGDDDGGLDSGAVPGQPA